MQNQYKRKDIFSCNYQTHQKFDNCVSVYHVLRSRKCYPQGCLYFKWHCSILEKGNSCKRGYKYVGRKCVGCKYYFDEKIHYQPGITVNPDEFRQFEQDLSEFEEWLFENEGKEVSFFGQLHSIKPRFHQIQDRSHVHIRLKGWLLIFGEGFLGTLHFKDPLYLHISPHQQERNLFAKGDQFETKAIIYIDRGRIVLRKAHHFEFETRSGEVTWTNSQALVARQAATMFKGQNETCLSCEFGALVDVEDNSDSARSTHRALYCFKGIADPKVCYLHGIKIIATCEDYSDSGNN